MNLSRINNEKILSGNVDEIIDNLINKLEESGYITGDNAFWFGRALAMMKGLLSVLIPLCNKGILFDKNGNKIKLLTFSFISEWIDIESLKSLYFLAKKVKKGEEKIHMTSPNDLDISKLEQYLSSIYLNIEDEEESIKNTTLLQHNNSLMMWKEILEKL